MKPYSRIQQFCAFSLILLFTIQAGLGLWLHRSLHQHYSTPLVYSNNDSPVLQQGATFSVTCTCNDDFLLPFTTVTNLTILPPFQVLFAGSAPADYRNVAIELQVFRPLRAPPVLAV